MAAFLLTLKVGWLYPWLWSDALRTMAVFAMAGVAVMDRTPVHTHTQTNGQTHIQWQQPNWLKYSVVFIPLAINHKTAGTCTLHKAQATQSLQNQNNATYTYIQIISESEVMRTTHVLWQLAHGFNVSRKPISPVIQLVELEDPLLLGHTSSLLQ